MTESSERSGADRREFLVGFGAALGGASWLAACSGESQAAPVPAVSSPKDGLIVHSEWCWETPRDQTQALITPNDKVFVRNNVPVPPAAILDDRDAWQLAVDGVAEPRTLRLADLKRMGVTTVAAVLQCSGNGRKYFEHGAAGSQWGVGAAANVVWTGVPVRAVIEALGGASGGARFLTAAGADRIPDMDPTQFGVERSIPLDKGMTDCLLAWEMNSEPIPLVHGGPLRLIVPGYYGVNNVKYVDRLACTPEESGNRYQSSSYRVRPVGADSSPEQDTMWAMNVKSWITQPLGQRPLAAGPVQVVGVAFGGEAAVDSVWVTVDGGASWDRASFLGPDLGPTAWRTFAYQFDALPGTYTLASRANDVRGNTQPETRSPNHRGYGNNCWRDPSVQLTVV